MITELTEHQKSMMPHYVDKWLTVGLDTSTIDQERARAAVIGVYENASLKPPKDIIFASGPRHGYKRYKDFGGKTSSDFLNGIVYGHHEAGWLSFYDFFRTEVGLKDLDKVVPLIELAKSCGWVYCAKDFAIAMDRPEIVKMDDQNRLHCEDGPAIRYRDNFEVYAWHGVRIPSEWIKNKNSLTAAKALKVENTEQRRAACEILGWINILKELKSKVVDTDEDPMIGTLVEVNIPDIGKEKFLRVLCGTGREFAIPVPPDMKTALEANCWTYGFSQNELRDLEIRT